MRNKTKDAGIRLSKKYGVNPTIPICFWCGKEKNEIALLGHIGDGRKGEDIEAPRNMVLDYDPCMDCKRNMGLGVTVIEVSYVPIQSGMPAIQDDLYPTGRWCVIREDAADRIFGDNLNGHDKVFVDQEVYAMFAQTEES